MNLSSENQGESPFVTPVAVEAWDTWFRWRENGALRDDTIDATWRRVASALASVEDESGRAAFERRLLDAFVGWRLLLDERVLATAGTGKGSWSDDDLVAVVNAACFVRAHGALRPTLDIDAMKDCADLAVHALDNAILLGNGAGRGAKKLRVGVIGLADALTSLGLDYAGAEARACAQSVAQALAEGSLRATVALAATRDAMVRCDASWIDSARRRGMPADLIERASLHGLRHASLTAITSQPRLARLANNASDAVLPAAGVNTSAGHGAARWTAMSATSVPAQLDMRGAMQPWIDEPIACPVRSADTPAPACHLDWYARAAALGLGTLSWSR